MKDGDILIVKQNVEGLWKIGDRVPILHIEMYHDAMTGYRSQIFANIGFRHQLGSTFNCSNKESRLYIGKYFYTEKEYRKAKLKQLGI